MPLEELFIPCKVSLGIFKRERTFEVIIGGKLYSGIVDETDIICEEKLQQGKTVCGKVRVYAIKEEQEKILVGFPRDTINGQRVWVSKDMVDYGLPQSYNAPTGD